jgi:hypothetical protein
MDLDEGKSITSAAAISEPKKVSIQGPPLQKAREMDIPPSKSIRPAPYKKKVNW